MRRTLFPQSWWDSSSLGRIAAQGAVAKSGSLLVLPGYTHDGPSWEALEPYERVESSRRIERRGLEPLRSVTLAATRNTKRGRSSSPAGVVIRNQAHVIL